MRVGIVRECKNQEGRVALTPWAVAELVRTGQDVLVESGAGVAAGFADAMYLQAGARLAADVAMVYAEAQLLVKVKEPQPHEVAMLRSGQLLFCYLHLAADPALAQALAQQGVSALAFETLTDEKGQLPLLVPMSRVAGALSIQLGAQLLCRSAGGKGKLLTGLPGLQPAQVVVLGGGVAGTQAALSAAHLGARVLVFDRKPSVWECLGRLHTGIIALPAEQEPMRQAVEQADLLIGAVLVPGAKAPRVVPKNWVKAMQPGSVIVDIAIDQGGCVETIRPTTHSDPFYVETGVLHSAITNLPGVVPRSATEALSSVLWPYVLELVQNQHWRTLNWCHSALNVDAGRILLPGV